MPRPSNPVPDRSARVEEAAERIFASGVLDDIYEHAYQHGKRGGLDNERDAMSDAVMLASLALDDFGVSPEGDR